MTGTHALNDEEFVRAFESCELSNESFHHADHIRLARIYVSRFGAEQATERFRMSLRRFAADAGKSEKYHETITVAWMQLVVHAANGATNNHSDEFTNLLDKSYIGKFYSPELLESDAARTRFVEPDRAKLPG